VGVFSFVARGKKLKAGDQAEGPGKKNTRFKSPKCRKV
jgi:hypothetical protein